MDITRRAEMAELMRERGVKSWLSADPDETEEQRTGREAQIARMAAAAGPKTTQVDVSAFLEAKFEALREHVTQIAADNFFLVLTPDEWRTFAPTEDFTLRVSRLGVRIPEDDLFAGLPDEA